MVSASEQVMSNMSLGLLAKAGDLRRRVLFTLLILLVCRFGAYLPLPGIDAEVFYQSFAGNQRSIIGLFNMFSGGAVGRMAIFALGIMPYISASIVVQLMSAVIPEWKSLKEEGEGGRLRLGQYARRLTIVIGSLQGFGVATGLLAAEGVVFFPRLFFILTTVATLLAGSILLMWLGEQISAMGVGNGTSLIIFSGIVAEFPDAVLGVLELSRQGSISGFAVLTSFMMLVFAICFVVFMERSQRRLLVQYPRRQVGAREMLQSQSSHLPLKVNMSGVIPPIFASALLLLPATVSSLSVRADGSSAYLGVFNTIAVMLTPGHLLYSLVYVGLISFFCFFYTAFVFDPNNVAKQLKKSGGFIPGVRPGEKTASYIDYVLTRITVLGALYISGVCLLPEFLVSWVEVPFYFGGTAMLIIVSVTMDTVAQVQGHLFSYQYEGLINRTKLRDVWK